VEGEIMEVHEEVALEWFDLFVILWPPKLIPLKLRL